VAAAPRFEGTGRRNQGVPVADLTIDAHSLTGQATANMMLTATDLAHGPVAVLDPLFPVWAIASRDETLSAVQEAVARVRQFGSTLVASGNAAGTIDADYRLSVPEPSVPLLSPLLSVLPGQLFAAALARAKGFDPDSPRGLTKVTLAR
jgi:glucosamine--fructose-6-phosphate aminotransferase (isomerizing)